MSFGLKWNEMGGNGSVYIVKIVVWEYPYIIAMWQYHNIY